MSEKDRIKWDDRYRKDSGGPEASALVRHYADRAAVGTALDIACGSGRNSLYLAGRGFSVDAVDISTVATRRLSGRHPDVHVIQADLDTWSIPGNRYTCILNIRFLDRRLFPMIQHGLKPGGVVIFEAFVSDEPDRFCLRPNELLREFEHFRVLYYEEKTTGRSEKSGDIAAFVGIKP